MKIGMIGLGRMGINMARRLMKNGHEVVVWNRSPGKVETLMNEGAIGAYTIKELTESLPPPRIVWLMLPAGAPTEIALRELRSSLETGDTVVEGGNSFYKDDIHRAKAMEEAGIRYMDAGVSGGIWGLDNGYCLMVGGALEEFARLEPIFKSLAPENGYMHCGGIGAGHFIKMVHNGIEYGMMQAYAEGFALIEDSPYTAELDFSQLAGLWNQGSVIRSWLLELTGKAFSKSRRLDELKGHVEDSGEGRWTIQQALETGTPVPVLSAALFERFSSRRDDDFRNRVLAAMRREFGGHPVRDKK